MTQSTHPSQTLIHNPPSISHNPSVLFDELLDNQLKLHGISSQCKALAVRGALAVLDSLIQLTQQQARDLSLDEATVTTGCNTPIYRAGQRLSHLAIVRQMVQLFE